MVKEETKDYGKKLLTAVERIVEPPERTIARVERLVGDLARSSKQYSRREVEGVAAGRLIASFSNKSAISGAATGLPAVVPGFGTLATFVGGALVDLPIVLKLEVEMVLSLLALKGFDITDERERQFGFLLASVKTYDASTGRSFLVDAAVAEGVALWNYGPRHAGKVLVSVLGTIAVHSMTKGAVRSIPLVGSMAGASVNKVLTRRVGRRALEEIEMREYLARHKGAQGSAPG